MAYVNAFSVHFVLVTLSGVATTNCVHQVGWNLWYNKVRNVWFMIQKVVYC